MNKELVEKINKVRSKYQAERDNLAANCGIGPRERKEIIDDTNFTETSINNVYETSRQLSENSILFTSINSLNPLNIEIDNEIKTQNIFEKAISEINKDKEESKQSLIDYTEMMKKQININNTIIETIKNKNQNEIALSKIKEEEIETKKKEINDDLKSDIKETKKKDLMYKIKKFGF